MTRLVKQTSTVKSWCRDVSDTTHINKRSYNYVKSLLTGGNLALYFFFLLGISTRVKLFLTNTLPEGIF